MAEWELDEKWTVPKQAWMLIDWNQNCRVVACAGKGLVYRVGEDIGWVTFGACGVGSWIEERRYDLLSDAWLIPLGGDVWFVFPQYHLSTGYLLLLRLPVPASICRALAERGTFGSVDVFPDPPMPRAERAGDPDCFLPKAMKLWTYVHACIPRRGIRRGTEGEEMVRLIRAVAKWNGMRLCEDLSEKIPTAAPTEENGDTDAVYDLPMFAALTLILTNCLHRRCLREVSVAFENIEEGLAMTLSVPGAGDDVIPETMPEIDICRELAERNCQIFSCFRHRGKLRMQICTVRKNFALLGVKTDPLLERDD